MHFMDGTDRAGLNDFNDLPESIVCGALVTHLRSNLVFAGQITEKACFIHRVGQGFLHIHMFAHAHGHCSGRSVRVVGRADRYRIDFLAH